MFPSNDAAALNTIFFIIKMQLITNKIPFYFKPCREKIKFIINLKKIAVLMLVFLPFRSLNPKHAHANMIAARPQAR